jgi:hypothetical protein
MTELSRYVYSIVHTHAETGTQIVEPDFVDTAEGRERLKAEVRSIVFNRRHGVHFPIQNMWASEVRQFHRHKLDRRHSLKLLSFK